MSDATNFRLIESPPLSGPENMALDEALLESMEAEQGKPVLRLYRWQPPALSLGFAQPVADVNAQALDQRGWDLVRRPTGGRAILHIEELTYAVILPLSHPLAAGGVLPSYQRLSLALRQALEILGLEVVVQGADDNDRALSGNPVCFEVPSAYELTVQSKKLIGSAQVRRPRAMLQHGTLPLTGDLGRICDVLHFQNDDVRRRARHRVTTRAGTVQELLGRKVTWGDASRAIQLGFSQAFSLQFDRSQPTEFEIRRADELANSRYQNRGWTERI